MSHQKAYGLLAILQLYLLIISVQEHLNDISGHEMKTMDIISYDVGSFYMRNLNSMQVEERSRVLMC